METVLGMTDLQIKLFTAIAQVGMAAMVGYIAYQQWQTARKKLKADLFDRRFAAYRDLVQQVHRLTDLQLIDMDAVTNYGLTEYLEIDRIGREMAWLFQDATADLVRKEVTSLARTVSGQLINLTETQNSSERMQLGREIMRNQERLATALGQVTKSVSPFLALHH